MKVVTNGDSMIEPIMSAGSVGTAKSLASASRPASQGMSTWASMPLAVLPLGRLLEIIEIFEVPMWMPKSFRSE